MDRQIDTKIDRQAGRYTSKGVCRGGFTATTWRALVIRSQIGRFAISYSVLHLPTGRVVAHSEGVWAMLNPNSQRICNLFRQERQKSLEHCGLGLTEVRLVPQQLNRKRDVLRLQGKG